MRRLALGETAAKAAAKTWAERNVAGGQTVSVVSAQDVQVGVWDATTATFTPAGSGVTPNAIQVTCRRLTARSNALPLFISPMLGQTTADVSATAIAVAKSSSSSSGTFRFLVDDEMFDTDGPGIEDLADAEGMTGEELLSDGDDDGFIDMPPGVTVELPTGQVGDERYSTCRLTTSSHSARKRRTPTSTSWPRERRSNHCCRRPTSKTSNGTGPTPPAST